MFSIGVVGYSQTGFNERDARTMILQGLSHFIDQHHLDINDIEIVSGLTDLGIPSIAYRIALDYGIKTVGIACKKANDYECFPVDEKIIVGKEWGDESKTFLDRCNVLIKVGGGEQSQKEYESFLDTHGEESCAEYDLELDHIIP